MKIKIFMFLFFVALFNSPVAAIALLALSFVGLRAILERAVPLHLVVGLYHIVDDRPVLQPIRSEL